MKLRIYKRYTVEGLYMLKKVKFEAYNYINVLHLLIVLCFGVAMWSGKKLMI